MGRMGRSHIIAYT
ncbi:hypothetical protein E2C01_091712 [Portunus trituberculatus]|uniref:Uncharacterized protein n=1 Tax=Portunus trituberculatus TaxID=210409 RepID=A0A5B7JPU2_PORTR|nr:hypothetical protein [Portunus trituberculatus]